MYIGDKACCLMLLWKNENRVHTTTRIKLFEASNDKLIPNNNKQIEGASRHKNKLPKFRVGDFVKFPDKFI